MSPDLLLPFGRASFMLDFVALAMLLIVPLVLWSIWQVKRGRYKLHARLQCIIAIVLLTAVTAFEVEIRIHGWRHLAEPSPYYETLVFPVLWVHLFFAISSFVLWIVTPILAVRKFGLKDPRPGPHSVWHKRIGWLATIDIIITTITGWVFYWLAFISSAPPPS